MVISSIMGMKDSTAEFMSLTFTMITLNLYDERYFMTEWKSVFPKYTNKKIAPLKKKNNYYLIKIHDFDYDSTIEKFGLNGRIKISNNIIGWLLSDKKYLSDGSKIWNRNIMKTKIEVLQDKLLKDLKNKIEVQSRLQRKYLFEPLKQKKQIFKRKNFSFQPQRYQIRRNQY